MTHPHDLIDSLPPDPAEAEVAASEALDQPLPLEADPADVADQLHSVEGFDEDYPGS